MLFALLLSAALVGADQIIKSAVAAGLASGEAVAVLPGIVELRYYQNTGAAFSILQNQQTFLIIVTGAALLALAYVVFFRRPRGKAEYLALILILAGGVGNWIDRVARGYVVDYISLLFVDFAVFNLADSLLTAGCVLLFAGVVHSEWSKKKRPASVCASPEEGGDGGGADGGEHKSPCARLADTEKSE